MRWDLDVTLRVRADSRRSAVVAGEVETRYGRQSFHGWLELLGCLEHAVERARAETESAVEGGGATTPGSSPSTAG